MLVENRWKTLATVFSCSYLRWWRSRGVWGALNLTLVSLDLLTYLSRKRSIESLAKILYDLIRRFYHKPFKIWNKSLVSVLSRSLCSSLYVWRSYSKAAWLSDKRLGLAIWRSHVRVPFWPHVEFGLFLLDLNPRPFCQLVASCPLKLLILLCYI